MENNNLNAADKILLGLEEKASREHLPILGPQKGKVLEDTIRQFSPKRILEIGTLLGYSAIIMAKNLGKDVEIITIELDREEAELAGQYMELAELWPKVKILVGNALSILPTLKGEFDLVFFDAAKEDNLEYLQLIEKRLRRGSVLVADNAGVMAEAMKDYLEHVRNSGKYKSKYVPVAHDGLEISLKL